jgi:hypothetical protein
MYRPFIPQQDPQQEQINSFYQKDPYEPHVAFGSVLTTNTRMEQDRTGIMPNNPNFGPKDFENPESVLNKKVKKKSVLDGETIKEIRDNIIELTPNLKDTRKAIRKMVQILELQGMENLDF